MITANHEPFVVDKNLGEKLQLGPDDLPRTNADGEPVIELTQEQKYLFDTRGWLLMPGVLDPDLAEEMRCHAEKVRDEPESLPEHERNYISGPLEKLTDHPVVVGFLLGPKALGGMLAGATVSGVLLALMMSNSGGAWDNAKKYIEQGNLGGKGSEPHKAAVVGDTVGDPFKDTSGPSMNILIKLMSVISLVLAPLFVHHGLNLF